MEGGPISDVIRPDDGCSQPGMGKGREGMHPIFMRRHRIVMYASAMVPAGPEMSLEE